MTKWRIWFLLFVCAMAGLGDVRHAAAHPADQHQQYHTITLSQEGIKVAWSIVVAPLLAPGLWRQADVDGNNVVTEAEATSWAASAMPQVQVTLDEAPPVAWRLDHTTWPASFGALQDGSEAIILELSATWPALAPGEHRLMVTNTLDPRHSASFFAVETATTVEVIDAAADQATRFVIRFAAAETTTDPRLQTTDRGPQTADAGQQVAGGTRSATLQRLSELLQTQNATPTFYLVALGVALALGALHALTPGHGKTVVAAYLVGSRGTSLHAVGLGAVTTVTHTGSVLLLGLIALLASRLIVPNDLFPILEVASGMLIVLLGANLLYRRWFEYRRASGQNDHHDHLHEHPHSHDRGDDTHGHSHDHGAYHSHGHVPESGQVTWRSLLALGISGGMVPCPDAIAILLLAIAIQRIGLGLALIVSFSLGLAVVLIAIGLAMLHSRRLFARMSAFDRASPVLPMVSAAIVLLLGIALTARAL